MSAEYLTPEQARELLFGSGRQKAKGHKYSAVPTWYQGERYDSRAEAQRASELDLLVRAGQVVFWSRQPVFELGIEDRIYKADFFVVYKRPDGLEYVVEEVKGYQTPQWKRNKSLWAQYGTYDLHVLTRSRGGWRREIVCASRVNFA